MINNLKVASFSNRIKSLLKLRFAYVFLAFIFTLGFFNTAQAQVSLDFSNTPTLEAGTALTQGARYRFSNVAPGTDALVTLTTITSNTQLVTIDNNASSAARFQPTIYTTSAGAATGYVRFDFQLVATGTNTPRAVPGVVISAQDIDGTSGSNREFIEFIGLTNTSVAGTTTLVPKTTIAGGVSYVQQTPGTNQTGIGTSNAYEFYGELLSTTTSFTIIGGSIVGAGGCTSAIGTNNCDRLNSYTFDPASSNLPVPNPNVSITKTGSTTVIPNGTVTYELIARNNGATTAHGSTVTDNVPASLTGVSISCSASGGAVCPVTTGLTTLSNVFIPTFPVGGQITFTVVGTAPSSGTISNVATIAPPNGSTDPDTTNNTSATINTTVLTPNLTISKSHTGSFVRGSTGVYGITVANSGTYPTSGVITVTDTLPTGLSVPAGALAISGANAADWNCTASGLTITCTNSNVLSNVAGSNSSSFNFSVNVATTAGATVTNSATVTGGNEPAANFTTTTANNTSTFNNSIDPTTTANAVDLRLTKTHTGNFTVGSTGTYLFTVINDGTVATSTTVGITVTDTLPAGLTIPSGAVTLITNANNWTCNAVSNVVTCTRAASATTTIAGNGTSSFSFNVNVGLATAVGTNSITNTASVSGGGETYTANNSASDPTTILSPNLTIDKSHTGDFTRGSAGTYTFSVGNSGTAATSGSITVTDTLPIGLSVNGGAVGGMTEGGINGADWSCNSNGASPQVITCTSSNVIAVSGTSVFNFAVNVALTAPASVTNNVNVSGGNEATANNGNNSDSDPTNVIANPPNVGLVKSCPSPADCTTAPQLPGVDVTYKIEFTNSGGTGAANMAIVDGIPTNMDYKIGSATANVATTGLTFVIEFSLDYDPLNPTFATWTYTPVSAGGGASVGYDRNVRAIRWRVNSGTLSNVAPNNTGDISFTSKIQ